MGVTGKHQIQKLFYTDNLELVYLKNKYKDIVKKSEIFLKEGLCVCFFLFYSNQSKGRLD